MNTVDEGSLKLPEEPPSLKVLGFSPSSTVQRHFYMDDTFVLMPEPGSAQATGAITSLSNAMRNLDQVHTHTIPIPIPIDGHWCATTQPSTNGPTYDVRTRLWWASSFFFYPFLSFFCFLLFAEMRFSSFLSVPLSRKKKGMSRTSSPRGPQLLPGFILIKTCETARERLATRASSHLSPFCSS